MIRYALRSAICVALAVSASLALLIACGRKGPAAGSGADSCRFESLQLAAVAGEVQEGDAQPSLLVVDAQHGQRQIGRARGVEAALGPGAEVHVELLRQGSRVTVPVRLSERPVQDDR